MRKFAGKQVGWMMTAALGASLVLGSVASAHVTVQPPTVTQGSYEKFAIRVPSEKDQPTVRVEVKFQTDGVTISRFEPKPGWTYEIVKEGDIITGVIWKATGDGLGPTEFGEFYMQGKVADTATSLTWKAYQTYKDGAVVEWTGAPDSKTPASVTKVNPKPAGAATDSHGHTHASPAASAPASTTAPAAGHDHAKSNEHQEMQVTSKTDRYLSFAGLAMGLLALIVSLARKK